MEALGTMPSVQPHDAGHSIIYAAIGDKAERLPLGPGVESRFPTSPGIVDCK